MLGGIQMDMTINIGHVLTFIGLTAGALTTAVKLQNTMHGHYEKILVANAGREQFDKDTAHRLEKMETRMNEIATATIAIARQDERMKAFEHRLESVEEDLGVLMRPGG